MVQTFFVYFLLYHRYYLCPCYAYTSFLLLPCLDRTLLSTLHALIPFYLNRLFLCPFLADYPPLLFTLPSWSSLLLSSIRPRTISISFLSISRLRSLTPSFIKLSFWPIWSSHNTRPLQNYRFYDFQFYFPLSCLYIRLAYKYNIRATSLCYRSKNGRDSSSSPSKKVKIWKSWPWVFLTGVWNPVIL